VNWLRFSSDGEWIAMVMDKQKEITFVSSTIPQISYREMLIMTLKGEL
jgi:hypothetical protein